MWKRALEWLRGAPIADPIDRRNTPVMQVLFLFLGVTTPVAWASQLAAFGMPRGGYYTLGSAVVLTIACFVCVWLIRKGRFRPSVILFLATLLATQEITHLAMGFRLMMMAQVDQILVLIVAALVLSRRALWRCFAVLCVIVISGSIVDAVDAARAGTSVAFAFSNVPSVVMTYAVIALVLDRTAAALRESLAESDARGRDLQREMAERERAQAQLIHAQKLEATGRLASGIAHDFNNILDVILGFAKQRHHIDEARDSRAQASALADSLDGVEIAAHRGTAITRKLLSFSRSDLLKLEVFDAGRAIAELQPMLRQLFPPDVRVEIAVDDEPMPIRMDRSELELMVLNIAANARDAMPDGGRFEVTVARGGDKVDIAMRDSGHGMDEQLQRQAFEPFFTTKSAADGTGLGLSVIRDLVAAAGGEIQVDSAVGAGSTFTIRLPLA